MKIIDLIGMGILATSLISGVLWIDKHQYKNSVRDFIDHHQNELKNMKSWNEMFNYLKKNNLVIIRRNGSFFVSPKEGGFIDYNNVDLDMISSDFSLFSLETKLGKFPLDDSNYGAYQKHYR